ncbi:zinc metalloprotease [Cryobacterium sp. 5B3]|uniref:zinc metalloprotease n=1 Tax=Cryobacterium sp. 5B3 TaxID=3048586 RepID=UPI002AB38A90|nr:zinc metalloprotease [Cryobacterium sp. 5B3]MDY7542241.1 zinc metalloprotease [Cryobacterium sp. 5B3]MEB0275673.1 zinc metalloprotease [Cryobacterium sp. 5B3]
MAVKEQEPPAPEDVLPTRRSCATSEVNERLIRTVDGYAEARAEIENRTYRVLSAGVALRTGCTQIPVVVHVVYRNAAENVSAAQIDSQIAVLNADFRAANADRSTTPTVFQPLIGDARVTFKLASTDPAGNPTDGITRTSTTTTPFKSNTDNVKSAATGGADPWPSDKYLNLWVCGNLQSGSGQALLGYAQFPGGPAATDGVVIVHTGFGTTGTAAAPFNLGRSATHEIGHWLNLRHIWGDDGNGCSGSDFVADTPNQAGPNFGAPTFPHPSCSNGPNGDLFMNYMDYVDDNTMYMFTNGQVDRMQAALDGPRSSIGVTGPCIGKSGKELSKDFPKDRPKDFIKEDPKDLIKDSPKDFVKDRPKDLIKDNPKDLIKDNPKDFVKDRPKDLVKDQPKDFAKDPIKEQIKDNGKDIIKDQPKDGNKDRPKDLVKDRPKDLGKDFVDDIPKQLRDPVKQLGGEVGPIDPGPLTGPLTGAGGIGDPGGVFGGGATPFVIGTGKDGAAAAEPDQGADGGPLLGIAQQLGGLLADYASAAATGQLTGAEVARWQQLASVYAQVIALLG